jgi:hypothetical protein
MQKGGTIPSKWCLILVKRLPAGSMRLIRSLVGGSVGGFKRLLRKAQNV